MKFKQRLIIFGFGAIMGAIIVTIIKAQRARDREPATISASAAPKTEVDIQREAVPGILQAYRERQVPMQSDFIKSSKLYAHPDDNTYRRVLILQGQEPEQTLRIEETILKRAQGEVVDSVRVMSADRLVVTLESGAASSELADAVQPWGYRIQNRGDAADQYILTLGAKEPETVADAIVNVSGVAHVVSAQPLYLDR
ncbi:hypothetical protein [Cerasicoccus frondis]|uniref:hypothetical protein n=1 Tax=Cerasicoccus frondis TaxID=490090 RepID=UPI002852D91D|nr:hypothetical protein [Cerasicoccus frondis]